MTNKLILYFIIIIFLSSCSIKKNRIRNETNQILKEILKNYDSVSLIKETYMNDSDIEPSNLINRYLKLYNRDIMKQHNSIKNKNIAYKVFYKNVDGVINTKELTEMKKKYEYWYLEEWNTIDVKNKKVNLISINDIKKYDNQIPFIRLSEPLFSKGMKKAILKQHYSKNGTGGKNLLVLKKQGNKWVIKGGISIGTTHTKYH